MTGIKLPDFRESRAVLIGVGTYSSNELYSLPGAVRNLGGVEDVLVDSDLSGFDPSHIQVVKDPSRPDEIMMALKRAAEEAKDVLLVYFAGHGLIMGDHGDLHLGLTESRLEEPWSALPFTYLASAIKRIPANTSILILDCCFSGNAPKDLMGDQTSLVAGQLSADGIYALTSTSKTKPAKAPEGDKYTAFTAHLIDVMREGAPAAGELLSMAELYGEVLRRMRGTKWPLPEQYNKNNAARLALVRNSAYAVEAQLSPIAVQLDLSRSRGVVVGVGSYVHEFLQPLPSSINDAKAVYEALLDPSICGFPPEGGRLLLDPASPDAALDVLADAAESAEDVLLFYFSGHSFLGETGGDLFMCMPETRFDRPWTALDARQIARILETTSAHTKVIILDTDYSGRMSHSLSEVRECYLITSTGPLDYSHKSGDHGRFTATLLGVLSKGISGRPIHLNPLDVYQALDRSDFAEPRVSLFDMTSPRCMFHNRSDDADRNAPHACLMTE